MTAASCPACGGVATIPVLELERMPVFCNVLASSPEDARAAATGDIALVQCATCAMVVNARFDPVVAGYSPGYENSLHHSPTFQSWARGLATRLVADHGLGGGTALEIGCGAGGFLALLCEAGMARGVGFDPSYAGTPDATVTDPSTLDLHRGLLDEGTAPLVGDADLAVCRHVLEHVTDPGALVELLRRAAPRALLYLEVPDGATMLEDDLLYDVLYEHCSYFTEPGLRALLARRGLRALRVDQEFGRQYLSVVARADCEGGSSRTGDPEVEAVLQAGARFGARSAEAIEEWDDRLHGFRDAGRDVAVWGAGSKGVTFANLVDRHGAIRRLVDLNPLKQGRYVPVSGQAVVAPADLVPDPPDVVVVMNPLYRQEVVELVRDLGVDAEVIVR